jgi:hypothetical protein
MSYIYSKDNRLINPHNYMYTPYQGIEFLQSYESSRMTIINRFVSTKSLKFNEDNFLVKDFLPVLLKSSLSNLTTNEKKIKLLLENISLELAGNNYIKNDNVNNMLVDFKKLTTTEEISTLNLLHSLINIFLRDNQNLNIKMWVNKLVQRFEVTKNIYESYLPGFRKGRGDNKLTRLYWLFSLTLSLIYLRSKKIKYLSTLLKVNDLICSLTEDDLLDNIPQHGVTLVLITEILCIKSLSNKKGISFAS